MNVALIGSVSSSYYSLEALIRAGVEITGVLGLDESLASTVSDFRSLEEPARQAGLPFASFVKISEPHVEQFIREHAPDLLWVIGLSQLVPDRLISIARHGGIGFHPTMLPRGRGRAPVAWTILQGEPAAANLFFLSDEPDAGDIIIQREVPVQPDDYAEDLIQRTNKALADAIIELAPSIKSGNLPRTPQDHSKATYYPKRAPSDGLIDWSRATEAIYRLVRAAGRPYPGAFCHLDGRKITIWRAKPADSDDLNSALLDRAPGTILRCEPDSPALVRTGDGGLWLTETQVQGRDAGRDSEFFPVGACFTTMPGPKEQEP